jgi:hypothetical protein
MVAIMPLRPDALKRQGSQIRSLKPHFFPHALGFKNI